MNEETIGKRISAHRKRLNLTQDALAEQLGVTAQAISKWENDQSCPDIAMLPKLAQVFGTTVDALLGVEPPAQKPTVPGEGKPDPRKEKEEGWHMEWNAGRGGHIAMAVWILLTGALLLLSKIQGRGAGLWELLWPSALLVFGGYALLRRLTVLRAGCVLFGGYFLLNALHMAPFFLGKELMFPLILLFLGLALFVDALGKPAKPSFRFTHNGSLSGKRVQSLRMEEEGFHCSTSFGENRHRICLPRLSGGSAEVSFGELAVDLTGCEEIADGCVISGKCSFGELEFLIPAGCRVNPEVSTAFGTLTVKGEPSQGAQTTVNLEGSVSFGEMKIKYL